MKDINLKRSKNTTIEWYTPKYIINMINYKNKRYMKKIKAKLQKNEIFILYGRRI